MQDGVNNSVDLSKCPICNGCVFVKKFDAFPLDYNIPDKFDIGVCVGCGHGITVGVTDDEVKELYETGNYDVYESRFRKLIRSVLSVLETNRVHMIKKWVTEQIRYLMLPRISHSY